MASKVVSYIRVSTQRQGASGLGLEAQQAAISEYCRAGGHELLQEFREVESGRKGDRPVLRKALVRAKASGSILVIAKLDRLGRDVHLISGLMKAGVDFRACDAPDKDPFMLHVRAAFAEEEARKVSQRTRDALRAAKRRGVKLGAANPACRKLTAQAQRKGSERTASIARTENAEATAIVTELRATGMSLPAIASELDARGILTRTGKTWNATGVLRLLRRAA